MICVCNGICPDSHESSDGHQFLPAASICICACCCQEKNTCLYRCWIGQPLLGISELRCFHQEICFPVEILLSLALFNTVNLNLHKRTTQLSSAWPIWASRHLSQCPASAAHAQLNVCHLHCPATIFIDVTPGFFIGCSHIACAQGRMSIRNQQSDTMYLSVIKDGACPPRICLVLIFETAFPFSLPARKTCTSIS